MNDKKTVPEIGFDVISQTVFLIVCLGCKFVIYRDIASMI